MRRDSRGKIPGGIKGDAKTSGPDGRALARGLSLFRTPSTARATAELAVTVLPFLGLWLATILLVKAGVWAGLILTIPAGAFLLRLFLIQHDCGHGALFPRRTANSWTGRLIGVLTFTPYASWRRSHAHHHADTGNLDRRGFGDIDILTLQEYRRLSPARRWTYRLYRNPVVLFGLGPAYQFLIRHRFPAGPISGGWRPWAGVMMTNGAIVLLSAGLIALVGAGPFLMVQLPITIIAATSGMWLFYIQHQFPHTVWKRSDRWSFHEAALHGSSYYDLPPVLRWFSANIGAHHVHHLCSGIPFYRIQGVLSAFPELKTIGRLGLRESLGTVRLALWNEEGGRLISFKQAGAEAI